MILVTSTVLIVLCLLKSYLWHENNISTDETHCKWSWMATLYFNIFWCHHKSVSYLYNVHQSSDPTDDIINYHVWLMIFFRWVSTSLPNFVISSVRYAKRGTAWKTQISVKEWFFSKKKSLVKSLIFWWNSLNWLSLCKIKDCCFHKFCVTFYVVCNVTKF